MSRFIRFSKLCADFLYIYSVPQNLRNGWVRLRWLYISEIMPRRTTLPAKSWMKTRSGINMLLPWWGGPQVAKHETPREFYGRFLIYIGKKILKKTSSNHWYGGQVWPSHKLTRPPSRTLKFGLKIVSIFSKLLLWSSIYRLICCCSTFMWSVSRSWGQIFEAFLFLLQNCLVLLNNCLIKASLSGWA